MSTEELTAEERYPVMRYLIKEPSGAYVLASDYDAALARASEMTRCAQKAQSREAVWQARADAAESRLAEATALLGTIRTVIADYHVGAGLRVNAAQCMADITKAVDATPAQAAEPVMCHPTDPCAHGITGPCGKCQPPDAIALAFEAERDEIRAAQAAEPVTEARAVTPEENELLDALRECMAELAAERTEVEFKQRLIVSLCAERETALAALKIQREANADLDHRRGTALARIAELETEVEGFAGDWTLVQADCAKLRDRIARAVAELEPVLFAVRSAKELDAVQAECLYVAAKSALEVLR